MIYTLEYIIKQIALGSLYFHDSWNIFDFLIVVVSDIFIVIEYVFNIPISSASVSSIRMFRILRVFRLLKKAKTLKILIETLIFILPSLYSILTLVFIGFFIFSALGINLFNTVVWTGELNK